MYHPQDTHIQDPICTVRTMSACVHGGKGLEIDGGLGCCRKETCFVTCQEGDGGLLLPSSEDLTTYRKRLSWIEEECICTA